MHQLELFTEAGAFVIGNLKTHRLVNVGGVFAWDRLPPAITALARARRGDFTDTNLMLNKMDLLWPTEKEGTP